MKSKLDICIVGCGSIGQRHLKVFSKTAGVRCSVCEPREEVLEKLKTEFPVKDVFLSPEDIDCSKFDAAVICTPAHLHVPIAARCLDAGCHVLSEKPLSVSLDGVEGLLETSRRKGLTVGVAFIYRFFPFLVKVKELIEEGAIGELHIMDTSLGEYYPGVRPDFRTTYFSRREMGGGVILDILSHVENYYEWLAGSPKEVGCMYSTIGQFGLETEDTVTFNASYGNNLLGNAVISVMQNDKYWRSRFVGSERTLQLNMNYLKTGLEVVVKPEIKLIDKQQNEEVISFEPMERDLPYQMQAEDFVDAVRGKGTPRTTLEEGIETLKTVLKAKESYDKKLIIPS